MEECERLTIKSAFWGFQGHCELYGNNLTIHKQVLDSLMGPVWYPLPGGMGYHTFPNQIEYDDNLFTMDDVFFRVASISLLQKISSDFDIIVCNHPDINITAFLPAGAKPCIISPQSKY